MSFSMDSERLTLQLRTKTDALCNHELLRGHAGGTTLSLEEVEQRLVEQNEEAQVEGFGLLGIRRIHDEHAIGYCGLIIGRSTFDEPEIAYEILPQFRGRGYATEAAGAVLEAAFATGRERLWATVGSWNTPSLRVLEKLGFAEHLRGTDERDEFIWMVRDAPA
jgi:RimJ/RimL family protein N-acetyltransferase